MKTIKVYTKNNDKTIISKLREKILTNFTLMINIFSPIFEESNHTYIIRNSNGKTLPSVSEMKKKFSPPFQTDIIAAAYARKHNIPLQVVLDDWEAKRKKSLVIGNDAHTYAKNHVESGFKITPTNDYQRGIYNFWKKNKKKLDILFLETPLMSLNSSIAGTPDVVCIDSNGDIIILDYKTNGDIYKQNKKQMLNKPLDFLPDSPYGNYCIQLNYYRLFLLEMLKKLKIKCKIKMYLIWVNPNLKDKYQIIKVNLIPRKYLS